MAFPRFGDVAAVPSGGACCYASGACGHTTSGAVCEASSGATYYPGCSCNGGGPCSRNETDRSHPCCKPESPISNSECVQPSGTYGSKCFMYNRQFCLDQGGTTIEDVACCEYMENITGTANERCPIPSTIGRCCKVFTDPNVVKCCDWRTREECSGPGDVWEPGKECAEFDAPGHYTGHVCGRLGACCRNGGCSLTTQAACEAAFGDWRSGPTCDGVDCSIGPPPDGEGCRTALVNFGRRVAWSLDLCNPVKMHVTIRNARQHPRSPNNDDWRTGLCELVSTHPVRAVEPDFATDFAEPCRRHFGGLALGPDGRVHPYVLSQPINGDDDSIELSLGALVQQPRPKGASSDKGDDDDAQTGRVYFVTTYHAPFWTEAHMHSQVPLCGVVE